MASNPVGLVSPIEEQVTPMKDNFIYHDFAKAFNSGLGDVVVRWIGAYLAGRFPRIHVDGKLSRTIPMRSGLRDTPTLAFPIYERPLRRPRITGTDLCG